MKKIITLLVLLVLGFIGYYLYVQQDIKNMKASILNEPFTFEYGETIILENDNFDLSYHLDYEEVGVQNVKVTFPYRGRILEKDVTLIIQDTTAPQFTKFKSHYELFENEFIKDIEKNYEAKDLSEMKLEFDLDAINFKKEGTYKGTVIAIDAYENKTEKEFDVLVRKRLITKPKEKPKTKPIVKNNNLNVKPLFVDGHIIVNKKHALPSNYTNAEDATAASKLKELIAEMKSLGLKVDGSYAGFRTYEHQERLYTNYAKSHGQKAADLSVAKSGHSEHQTGLAFDLRSPSGVLLQTETETTWLKNNAHRFGFVIRYPENKTHITGYKHEPWHLRYMGSDAVKIYESNLTLEEYYNLEA